MSWLKNLLENFVLNRPATAQGPQALEYSAELGVQRAGLRLGTGEVRGLQGTRR